MTDMFKHALLLQLREQQTFVVMQWRQDLLDYFVCHLKNQRIHRHFNCF